MKTFFTVFAAGLLILLIGIVIGVTIGGHVRDIPRIWGGLPDTVRVTPDTVWVSVPPLQIPPTHIHGDIPLHIDTEYVYVLTPNIPGNIDASKVLILDSTGMHKYTAEKSKPTPVIVARLDTVTIEGDSVRLAVKISPPPVSLRELYIRKAPLPDSMIVITHPIYITKTVYITESFWEKVETYGAAGFFVGAVTMIAVHSFVAK